MNPEDLIKGAIDRWNKSARAYRVARSQGNESLGGSALNILNPFAGESHTNAIDDTVKNVLFGTPDAILERESLTKKGDELNKKYSGTRKEKNLYGLDVERQDLSKATDAERQTVERYKKMKNEEQINLVLNAGHLPTGGTASVNPNILNMKFPKDSGLDALHQITRNIARLGDDAPTSPTAPRRLSAKSEELTAPGAMVQPSGDEVKLLPAPRKYTGFHDETGVEDRTTKTLKALRGKDVITPVEIRNVMEDIRAHIPGSDTGQVPQVEKGLIEETLAKYTQPALAAMPETRVAVPKQLDVPLDDAPKELITLFRGARQDIQRAGDNPKALVATEKRINGVINGISKNPEKAHLVEPLQKLLAEVKAGGKATNLTRDDLYETKVVPPSDNNIPIPVQSFAEDVYAKLPEIERVDKGSSYSNMSFDKLGVPSENYRVNTFNAKGMKTDFSGDHFSDDGQLFHSRMSDSEAKYDPADPEEVQSLISEKMKQYKLGMDTHSSGRPGHRMLSINSGEAASSLNNTAQSAYLELKRDLQRRAEEALRKPTGKKSLLVAEDQSDYFQKDPSGTYPYKEALENLGERKKSRYDESDIKFYERDMYESMYRKRQRKEFLRMVEDGTLDKLGLELGRSLSNQKLFQDMARNSEEWKVMQQERPYVEEGDYNLRSLAEELGTKWLEEQGLDAQLIGRGVGNYADADGVRSGLADTNTQIQAYMDRITNTEKEINLSKLSSKNPGQLTPEEQMAKFVTETYKGDEWNKLLTRMHINYAAKNGYDEIMFPKGDAIAEIEYGSATNALENGGRGEGEFDYDDYSVGDTVYSNHQGEDRTVLDVSGDEILTAADSDVRSHNYSAFRDDLIDWERERVKEDFEEYQDELMGHLTEEARHKIRGLEDALLQQVTYRKNPSGDYEIMVGDRLVQTSSLDTEPSDMFLRGAFEDWYRANGTNEVVAILDKEVPGWRDEAIDSLVEERIPDNVWGVKRELEEQGNGTEYYVYGDIIYAVDGEVARWGSVSEEGGGGDGDIRTQAGEDASGGEHVYDFYEDKKPEYTSQIKHLADSETRFVGEMPDGGEYTVDAVRPKPSEKTDGVEMFNLLPPLALGGALIGGASAQEQQKRKLQHY